MKKHASAYTLLEDIRDAIIVVIGTVYLLAKGFLLPLIVILLFVMMTGGLAPDHI